MTPEPVRERAGAGERVLRRRVAARRGQQRVHARGASPLEMLGERTRVVPRDRRDDVPRPVRGELGAERDDAAREIAAEPRGAAHDVDGIEVGA